jgi:hypothetical protein
LALGNNKGDVRMKTLIVLYSKTGNTRKVAQRVKDALGGDIDEISFDEAAHTIAHELEPAAYERVILMCPVWAFSLPEPMKLYLERHKGDIKNYRLAVTCGMFGLGGCVSGCKKILGRGPESALKIRSKRIEGGEYSLDKIVK